MALNGEWLHSHEEDGGGRTVLRPSSWAFPPSRGRAGYRFGAKGVLGLAGPGPADKTGKAKGSWKLDGDTLTLARPGQAARRFRVLESTPEKLELEEQHG